MKLSRNLKVILKSLPTFFSQLRKNKNYNPPDEKVKHTREILDLLSTFTEDKRFIDSYNERMKGGQMTMLPFLDEIENRGFDKGHAAGVDEGMKQGASKLGRLVNYSDLKKSELVHTDTSLYWTRDSIANAFS